MNGLIFLFTFLGWLVYHFKSIKKFNSSTPNLNPWISFKGYFINDFWGFIISATFLVVIAFLISVGMSDIISSLLGVPVEFQTDRLQIVLAFYCGVNIQLVADMFTKTTPVDERKLDPIIKQQQAEVVQEQKKSDA